MGELSFSKIKWLLLIQYVAQKRGFYNIVIDVDDKDIHFEYYIIISSVFPLAYIQLHNNIQCSYDFNFLV